MAYDFSDVRISPVDVWRKQRSKANHELRLEHFCHVRKQTARKSLLVEESEGRSYETEAQGVYMKLFTGPL